MNINIRAFLLLCFSLVSLAAQSLQITSPASGTVANPGQTLTVSVAASGGTFQQVYILGQDPIPISQPLSSPPYQFTIQVPTNIRPDRYTLTAGGFTSPGQGFDSDPIDIDIERPDNPISIRVEPSILELTPGETGGLRIIGLFNDGGARKQRP